MVSTKQVWRRYNAVVRPLWPRFDSWVWRHSFSFLSFFAGSRNCSKNVFSSFSSHKKNQQLNFKPRSGKKWTESRLNSNFQYCSEKFEISQLPLFSSASYPVAIHGRQWLADGGIFLGWPWKWQKPRLIYTYLPFNETILKFSTFALLTIKDNRIQGPTKLK